MGTYVYPATDWDRPKNLLAALGSFWAEIYSGRHQILAYAEAKGQIEGQTLIDLLHVIESTSRSTAPVYHRDNWYALRLLASERNSIKTVLPEYDGTLNYDDGHQYDQPLDTVNHAFPAPASMANAPLIMNRFTEPSLMWASGVDFVLKDSVITFRTNPFSDNRVVTRPVYQDGQIVDTEALLWVFRGEWDWETIYRQYGYVLNVQMESSTGYRDLLNALFDSLIGGTTRSTIERAFVALTGIPLVLEPTETVQHVTLDRNGRLIITDQHVYRFSMDVLPVVAAGDTVHAGDPLVDALQIYELNRGQVPSNLLALSVGKGFLATCYYSDLIFENREVPLEVTEAEDDPYGFTYVKFGLGGFPLDVQQTNEASPKARSLSTNAIQATLSRSPGTRWKVLRTSRSGPVRWHTCWTRETRRSGSRRRWRCLPRSIRWSS
jgi:hypothetical protein